MKRGNDGLIFSSSWISLCVFNGDPWVWFECFWPFFVCEHHPFHLGGCYGWRSVVRPLELCPLCHLLCHGGCSWVRSDKSFIYSLRSCVRTVAGARGGTTTEQDGFQREKTDNAVECGLQACSLATHLACAPNKGNFFPGMKINEAITVSLKQRWFTRE